METNKKEVAIWTTSFEFNRIFAYSKWLFPRKKYERNRTSRRSRTKSYKRGGGAMLPAPDYLQVIALATTLLPKQVSAVLELT